MKIRMKITREGDDYSDDLYVTVDVDEGIPSDWAKDDDGNKHYLSEAEKDRARDLWEKDGW